MQQHVPHCTKHGQLVDINLRVTVVAGIEQFLALAHMYAHGTRHIKNDLVSHPTNVGEDG